MIAYRAETAMVALLRRYLNKEDEARALVKSYLFLPPTLSQTISARL